MNKPEYNRKISQHLGALEGIAEVMPVCDKPCNVHEAINKRSEHQLEIIKAQAQYTGNGMSQDIADAVAAALLKNRQVGKPVNVPLPGGRIWTITRQAIATWIFRVVLLAAVSWCMTGKVDRAVIRQVIMDELKGSLVMKAEPPVNKAVP